MAHPHQSFQRRNDETEIEQTVATTLENPAQRNLPFLRCLRNEGRVAPDQVGRAPYRLCDRDERGLRHSRCSARGRAVARGVAHGFRDALCPIDIDGRVCDAVLIRRVEARGEPKQSLERAPSSGAFERVDGFLMLSANNDPQFSLLCNALDRQSLPSDARI